MDNSDIFVNRDLRPGKHAWAPGVVKTTCIHCDEPFYGHRLAAECAPCAYEDRPLDNVVILPIRSSER